VIVDVPPSPSVDTVAEVVGHPVVEPGFVIGECLRCFGGVHHS
jgi:hypothetical protein